MKSSIQGILVVLAIWSGSLAPGASIVTSFTRTDETGLVDSFPESVITRELSSETDANGFAIERHTATGDYEWTSTVNTPNGGGSASAHRLIGFNSEDRERTIDDGRSFHFERTYQHEAELTQVTTINTFGRFFFVVSTGLEILSNDSRVLHLEVSTPLNLEIRLAGIWSEGNFLDLYRGIYLADASLLDTGLGDLHVAIDSSHFDPTTGSQFNLSFAGSSAHVSGQAFGDSNGVGLNITISPIDPNTPAELAFGWYMDGDSMIDSGPLVRDGTTTNHGSQNLFLQESVTIRAIPEPSTSLYLLTLLGLSLLVRKRHSPPALTLRLPTVRQDHSPLNTSRMNS